MRISDWSSDVCSSDLVVVHQQAFHAQAQQVGIGEVAEPDGAAADLVLVGRADAAPGGADLAVALGRLARAVHRAVHRQDERDALGARSEERRVGKEGGSTWRVRW